MIDTVINSSGSAIDIRWNVTGTDFPTSWLSTVGLCDACNCVPVNTVTPTVDMHDCNYGTGNGDYHMLADLTGLPAGCHYLTVRLWNIAATTDTARITFMVCKWPTGVNNAVSADEVVKLFPNPASDVLTVSIPNTKAGDHIVITDLTGRVMLVKTSVSAAQQKLGVATLAPGMYYVRHVAADGNSQLVGKFMKE